VRLPFSYQLLNGKIVLPEKHQGVALDIGYHGLLAEPGAEDLALYAEVKLELYLPLVAFRAEDIYARVVKVMRRGSAGPLVGLEFTSVSAEANRQIQLFVQMLIQGSR
jgi:hypothetical protein